MSNSLRNEAALKILIGICSNPTTFDAKNSIQDHVIVARAFNLADEYISQCPKASLPSKEEPPPSSYGSKVDPRFANGKWRDVLMHWEGTKNKVKGRSLGWICENKRSYFHFLRFDWEPKPYNGDISPADQDLRLALNAANLELGKPKGSESLSDPEF